MYVKHPDYPVAMLPIPGDKDGASVQLSNHVAEVSAAVGKKLTAEGSEVVEIDKAEYDAATLSQDLRTDLPMVHSKDGATPRPEPKPGELPNPLSNNPPEILLK